MSVNESQIPTGITVASQIPLNFNSYHPSQNALKDLGDEQFLAFMYHKGKDFYCAEEQTRWVWDSLPEDIPDAMVFLMDEHFVYPNAWVVNGIDYSGKAYNFIKVQNVTLENVANYIIAGPPGRGITGIAILSTSGLNITYRITYTDSTHFDYVVTNGAAGANGRGVTGIAYLSSAGVNDTYRISYSDGTHFDYSITNGINGTNGITPIMTRASNDSRLISNSASYTFNYPSTPNLGWTAGMRLRFFAVGGGTNYMEGIATAVGPTAVNVTMDYAVGSGTFASWYIGIAGDVGKSDNPQKTLVYPTDFTSSNYNLQAGDNNYTIFIENGTNPVTITVASGLPTNIVTCFIQKGSGLVTFVASGVTINSPTGGLKIKGQRYAVAIQGEITSGEFTLLGNSKT